MMFQVRGSGGVCSAEHRAQILDWAAQNEKTQRERQPGRFAEGVSRWPAAPRSCMEYAHMSAVWTARDWRGLKYHVSSCSTDELLNLLTNAIMTTDQVAKFIAEVQAEL